MFETEEVDIDYFTPSSSTSLSKIFSNNIQTDEGQENSTLKYVPPLPTQSPKPKEEKPSQQVLYVVTVNAYEWLRDSYVSKEKVGFVIIKIIKSGLHNIILYDSNKTILSSLTLTTDLRINVRENVSISFYDNHKKYWTVYTTPHEINQILDILKGLQVNLKYVDTKKNLSQKDDNINRQHISSMATNPANNESKESDTDSSVNRRTKDSILKRMATMGQSVLPPTHLITQTSDSSDTNESINQNKSRHKPYKSINKRNLEKSPLEIDNNNDLQINIAHKPLLSSEINKNIYQNSDQQIVAMKTMKIIKSPVGGISEGNEMNLFISEQRVSNSELRINMSRMTDKLDLVLEKVKCLDNVDKSPTKSNTSHLQHEITIKLLNEYEKKIKNFEAFIKSKGFQCDTFEPIPQSSDTCNIEYLNVNETKQLCEDKDRHITQLKEEIQTLTSKLEEKEAKDNESSLIKEISELKENIITQKNQIDILNKKVESAHNLDDIQNKLKSIMNDTFQVISTNFDSNASYSGATVKSTVASIMKKMTMACLKDL
ncbi:unnamed protein product [Euphydryas editha]|uniref:Uncharacterized protein n=1 Tax=Euphydryas editha TaxID=104508 RepID=A0AAU9ULX1_EUPED|nr:unnamed protein product [Euphydryas editha]